ncbi:hypothetical protein ABEV55_11300 [Aneurinibacillus thermoaerophilus]|uniref:hypothetical protein n=1 Tax=Aneurinibacillus thermoaerophilus TaxID=143495 RepID=UPI002E1A9466|nr:hypothetical protein [Aneurinibacillus thermoaerophilus]
MLSNCAACGKVFMKFSKPVCPDCASKELDTAKRIRDYLKQKEKRNAPLIQVSQDLDIPVRYIEYLIRQKYFDLARYPNLQYQCKNCDTLISSGEYCAACAETLRNHLLSVQKDKTKSDKQSDDFHENFYKSRL